MKYTALIVAAGKGSSQGLGYNKVFFQLTEEETVLEKTIGIFLEDENCHDVVVVVAASEYQRCISKYQRGSVTFVSGGETRMNSVYNGLMAVSQNKVLIHDGTRPYLPLKCLRRVVQASAEYPAIIPAINIRDTIKVFEGDCVKTTLKKAVLCTVQTPQAFDTELIVDCYRQALKTNFEADDDAHIVEAFSEVAIKIVAGSHENIKITTVEDLL